MKNEYNEIKELSKVIKNYCTECTKKLTKFGNDLN